MKWIKRFNWFYKYDFFISYRQNDGENYASALHDVLTNRGYKCFIDKVNVPVQLHWRNMEMGLTGEDMKKYYSEIDNHLRQLLGQSLRKTSVLIFLASDGAFLSQWVQYEINHFPKKRPLVPVGTDDLIEKIDLLPSINNSPDFKKLCMLYIKEERNRFDQGRPSNDIIDTIEKTYKISKQWF